MCLFFRAVLELDVSRRFFVHRFVFYEIRWKRYPSGSLSIDYSKSRLHSGDDAQWKVSIMLNSNHDSSSFCLSIKWSANWIISRWVVVMAQAKPSNGKKGGNLISFLFTLTSLGKRKKKFIKKQLMLLQFILFVAFRPRSVGFLWGFILGDYFDIKLKRFFFNESITRAIWLKRWFCFWVSLSRGGLPHTSN